MPNPPSQPRTTTALTCALALLLGGCADGTLDRAEAEETVRELHQRSRPGETVTDIRCRPRREGWDCRFNANGQTCEAGVFGPDDHPEGAVLC